MKKNLRNILRKKMHKYIITRGKSVYVDTWKDEMEANFLPIPMKDGNGKDVAGAQIQLVMRPVQLWELVYPEGQEQKVLSLIGITGYDNKKLFTKIKEIVCKMLGLENPQKEASIMNKAIPRPFVGVHILGNKKDDYDAHGNEML